MRLLGALMNWLLGLKPLYKFTRKTKPDRLLELRNVCYTLLDDLDTPAGKGLQTRVDVAASANDFWHMRPRMFDAISAVHGQSAAAQRLAPLDTLLRVHHDRRSQMAGQRSGSPADRRRASDRGDAPSTR